MIPIDHLFISSVSALRIVRHVLEENVIDTEIDPSTEKVERDDVLEVLTPAVAEAWLACDLIVDSREPLMAALKNLAYDEQIEITHRIAQAAMAVARVRKQDLLKTELQADLEESVAKLTR